MDQQVFCHNQDSMFVRSSEMLSVVHVAQNSAGELKSTAAAAESQ